VFLKEDGKVDYLTLKEALDKKVIAVNEVSEGGSVPDLVIDVNEGIKVLILDGEELFGAKQNRILNTTVLLWGKSRTTVPVSCTERGRWHFTSRSFHDSDNLAHHSMRVAKTMSVSDSLKAKRGYHSDQAKVWQEVANLQMAADVPSATSAMRDVFEARKMDMNGYLRAFEHSPGQKGMLVFINGEVAGLDIVSREQAFRVYREKMLRSYCIDAMYSREKDRRESDLALARQFLEKIAGSKETKFKSVGRGDDRRYEGAGFTGAALEVDGEVLHMAFLSTARL